MTCSGPGCDIAYRGGHHGVRQYVAEFGVSVGVFDYTPANSAMVNFVMRFKDGRVTMENAEGETSESTYKIIANAEGPVLSFDTYSILHDLADPSECPLGTSKGGEFEFVVCQVTEDTIYVRGRKSGNDFKLSRAAEGEIQHVRFGNSLGYRRREGYHFLPHLAGGGRMPLLCF